MVKVTGGVRIDLQFAATRATKINLPIKIERRADI